MVRTRYIGSNRTRQAGYSATAKQDFNAHVTGGDWVHPASNISEIYSGNVQQALVDLYNIMLGLGNVITLGTPWSFGSGPGSIPMFTGTKEIESSPLKISYDGGYSGLIFEASAAYPLITQDAANYPGGAPYLLIQSQNNLDSIYSGAGGELWLASGHNLETGANWGILRLISLDALIDLNAPILQFNSDVVSPTIKQGDIAAGNANDLRIVSQNTQNNGTPSNLWLESGTNSIGQAGNIYLSSSPGGIYFGGRIISPIIFDSTSISPTIYQDTINSSPGQPLTIQAQSSINDAGGDLVLSSGQGVWTGSSYWDGNVVLNANDGHVQLLSPNFLFSQSTLNPLISQEGLNPSSPTSANNLTVAAQSNTNGPGGDLWLMAGSDGSGTLSNILLVGLIFLPNIGIPAAQPSGGVYIYANSGNLYCMGSDGIAYRLNEAPVSLG